MSTEHANNAKPAAGFAVETFRGPLIIVTAMLASSLAMLGFAIFLGS